MNKYLYLVKLYDYYGCLLTDKQKLYFEDYYFNNLSLKEISDNYNISRNAVHKQLKETESKLSIFEEKLNLIAKADKIEQILRDINNDKIKEQINELI